MRASFASISAATLAASATRKAILLLILAMFAGGLVTPDAWAAKRKVDKASSLLFLHANRGVHITRDAGSGLPAGKRSHKPITIPQEQVGTKAPTLAPTYLLDTPT